LIEAQLPEEQVKRLVECTYRGRPCGDESFVKKLEDAFGRPLSAGRGGRKKTKPLQGQLSFFNASMDA
jgi:hypothetical protein